MKKMITITVLAITITMGLFAFMAFLINNDNVEITTPEPDVSISLYKIPEPKKPLPPKRMPAKPKVTEPPKVLVTKNISSKGVLSYKPNLPIDVVNPKLDFTQSRKDMNHDAHPIVRVNPKYPMVAAREGIEGWVKLKFDINNLGEVINVEVISSNPKKIFDKAAKRALSKWKYKAKAVEGEYVNQTNLSVQLDFQMDKAG